MAGKNNKAGIIVIVAAILVAAAGYFLTQKNDANDAVAETAETVNETMEAKSKVDQASSDTAEDANNVETPANIAASDFVVEEGNPVVAKVDGVDITRLDVYRFIQTMPANVQQMPAIQVYPLAMEQVINTRIIQNKADQANLQDTDQFKAELEMAKQQIERNLFLQNQVNDKIADGRLKKSYNEFVKKLPEAEERRARHILLDTKEKAIAAIEKLGKGNETFEDLAKSLSQGPTASKGGDLGYFAKDEMVPEFANAAFSMGKGEFSKTPVKSQFGWHVIKVEDVRQRPKPTFEQMKPTLEAEARREVLDELLGKWREKAKIEQFDINGQPLKEGSSVIGVMPEQPAG